MSPGKRRPEIGQSGSRPARLASHDRPAPIRKRDAARTQKLRTVIRYMLERGTLAPGHQVRLAQHFNLTRQRVNQLVALERESLAHMKPARDEDAEMSA